MRKPNFLIIGAARSGTTTFTHCLALHPQVYMPITQAEPKFFSRKQEYEKGPDYYLQKYFTMAGQQHAIGEKSTEYLETPVAAERIFRFDQDMKLICVLRDPVERAVSNYFWSVSNKVETRPINESLRIELENDKHAEPIGTDFDSARPHAYVQRSRYHDNLLPFYNLFSNKNILCIVFEEFINNRNKIIEEVITFLNLDTIDLPLDKVKEQRSVEANQMPDRLIYNDLVDYLKEKNKHLATLTGKDTSPYWYKKR